MVAGIEVLIKTAHGEADISHEVGDGDTFKAFLAETFGSGPQDELMSVDLLLL